MARKESEDGNAVFDETSPEELQALKEAGWQISDDDIAEPGDPQDQSDRHAEQDVSAFEPEDEEPDSDDETLDDELEEVETKPKRRRRPRGKRGKGQTDAGRAELERLRAENEQLRAYSANTQVTSYQSQVTAHLSAKQREVEALSQQMVEALESGETAKHVELQRKLNAAQYEEHQLRQAQAQADQQAQALAQQAQQAQQQPQQQAPSIDQEAMADFMDGISDWYGQDQAASQQLQRIDNALAAEGTFEYGSQSYFDELERRAARALPDYFDRQRAEENADNEPPRRAKRQSDVLPPSGESPPSRRSKQSGIRLTAEDKRAMALWGYDPRDENSARSWKAAKRLAGQE